MKKRKLNKNIKKEYSNKNKNINKTILCNNNTASIIINNYSNPINQLISNMPEINELLKLKTKNLIELIYFNRRKIEHILYVNEEIFNIETDFIEEKLKNCFYLSLLISENNDIINYSYSINLIRKVNKLSKKDKKHFLKNILISKIIIELIEYYIQTDNYDEKEEDELTKIKKENLNYIKNNLYIINDLNLNYTVYDINRKKIDLIYIEIIIALIKEKKFYNYEYAKNILNQLDIENINITKTILEKISKLFENKKFKNNNYNIITFNDLNNTRITSFYFLLFKYILKNPIYIYHIPFLYETKKNIIRNIKNTNEKFEEEEKKYVINFLLDFNDYYLKDYSNNLKSKKILDNNYINKDKSIEKDEQMNENDAIGGFIKITFVKKILYKSSFLIKNNEKGEIEISQLNDEKEKEKEDEDFKNRNKNLKIEKDTKLLEANFTKFLEFISIVKENIEKYFINRYNLLIKLNFSQVDDNNNSNYIYNIKCQYIFYPPNKDRFYSFHDYNVLIDGINGSSQGFYFLINEINDTYYRNILYRENINISNIMKEKDNYENNPEANNNVEKEEKEFSLHDIVKSDIVSEYEIIKLKEIIGNHSKCAEFIQSLSNGYFISWGNSRSIYIYNQNYIKIAEIILSIVPNGVYQIKNHYNEKNIIEMVAFSNENINIISFETNFYNYNIKSYKAFASNILEINRNKTIITNVNGTYLAKNLKNFLEKNKLKKILKYSYKAIIKVSDEIIALTSNKIIPNGKNSLVLYNIFSNEILYELNGYSFSLSINSLLLMDNYIYLKDNKLLLCACKKYTSHQNNGILLLKINLENHRDNLNYFYNTESFEPYCFCPILLIDNSKENNKNSGIIYSTDYLFIGGFDLDKGEGVIKLYKIIFEYNSNAKIEYIQDIIMQNEINNFYGFKGAVTYIFQSKNDGNFLITSSDGKVYLFSPANINYFLFYDEEEKKKLD